MTEFDFHNESTLIISIKWMGKLRHREIKVLMGHLPVVGNGTKYF